MLVVVSLISQTDETHRVFLFFAMNAGHELAWASEYRLSRGTGVFRGGDVVGFPHGQSPRAYLPCGRSLLGGILRGKSRSGHSLLPL